MSIPICYFRSSSYNLHDGCEQAYFIEYILGRRGTGNLKADKGTIVHKCLEILALCKYNQQKNIDFITDECTGDYQINTKNQDINTIVDLVYDYYKKLFSHNKWQNQDRLDIHKWLEQCITMNDKMFDPRLYEIISPELSFDFEINKPWAKYEKNGEVFHLALKGTIDLVTKDNIDSITITDYKSGAKSQDFYTGEIITIDNVKQKPQLRIYHYALKHYFPDIKYVNFNLLYFRASGNIPCSFDDSDLEETELMIKRKYEYIKKTIKPNLNRSWRCTKTCHSGKNTFEDSDIKPLIEFRNNKISSKGENMTICDQIDLEISRKGINNVIKQYTNIDFNPCHYKSPGQL